MRAVQLHEHGGPDVLTVADIERPTPSDDELLIEVAAAGVNPVDTYFRDGSYAPVDLPFTPGVDFAGTVIDSGDGVSGFSAGDRVFGAGIGNGDYQGAYAEYAVVPTDRTGHLPDGVDFIDAGAAGVVAGTAWRALIDHGRLEPGDDCLIHGGSGGVGHAAVQIGAAVQANVVSTASPDHRDTVSAIGADTVIEYGRDDLDVVATEATDGGFDVVLDHRLDEYLQFDADVAAKYGRVVGIGENDPGPTFSAVGSARSKDVSYHFMSLFNTPDLGDRFRRVAHLLDEGVLLIAIEEKYTLDEAAEAQRAVIEDSYFGKLVMVP